MNGFTDIPAEQTTAITDVILAIVSGSGAYWIYRAGKKVDTIKTKTWTISFVLLTIAAVIGSIAHGINMSEETNRLIWHPLNLSLGLSVALFVVGVIYDIREFEIPKLYVVMIILSGLVFFGITLIYPGLFFVFILYEAIAMFFALSSYTFLLVTRKLPGSGFMFTGILISITASVVQALPSISVTVIWIFDHNGLFHLIQIAGLFFLYIGLIKEFKSRVVSSPDLPV